MKLRIKYIALAVSSLMAMTSCEEDATLITPDTSRNYMSVDPGTSDKKIILSSESTPGSDVVMVLVSKPEEDFTIEMARVVLPQAYDHDVTVRVGMNENFDPATYPLKEFNDTHNFQATFEMYDENWKRISPTEVIRINGEKAAFITIEAGKTESDPVEISFKNNKRYLGGSTYAFPVEVSEVETGEIHSTTMFVKYGDGNGIMMMETYGTKPAVFIGYVDTEVMQPQIYNTFYITLQDDDYMTGESDIIYSGPLFDIINIRTAFIKDAAGQAKLSPTEDLEYVLHNRNRYIRPLQTNEKKVCLCIKGGGTGLGFSNMTDAQVQDFAGQVKAYVDMYGLDGVNLWDEGAGYDKEGAAPVSAASYAKLIKALKTAMPDKLLTLVDTRETTESLCDPVEGISVGDYVDYAWSTLHDFLAPYEPDATIRPLASLPESHYSTYFVHDPYDLSEDKKWDGSGINTPKILIPYILDFTKYEPLSGTDVFVYDDIPNHINGNEGVYQDMGIAVWAVTKYPVDADFSHMVSATIQPTYIHHYNSFKKDW